MLVFIMDGSVTLLWNHKFLEIWCYSFRKYL